MYVGESTYDIKGGPLDIAAVEGSHSDILAKSSELFVMTPCNRASYCVYCRRGQYLGVLTKSGKGTVTQGPTEEFENAPGLPNWESVPSDAGAATRQLKSAIRTRIEWFGRSVPEVVDELERALKVEVAEIVDTVRSGGSAWPVIDFAEIGTGTVSVELTNLVKRRGCVVVRGTFSRQEAEGWDRDMLDYVDSNGFFQSYSGPADDFFGSLGRSRPEIYPIYWSRGQMEARQHPHMHAVQMFLSSLWTFESDGRQWFDPSRNSLYPDRLRRRPPGTNSRGLGDHLDPGTLDMWMAEGYQRHFQHLWDGDATRHDPWDASYRTEAAHYPGSTMCSAFRTFQGWTALSDMRHDQGVLHTVPIAKAIAYLMMRPLLDDVEPEDLCDVRLNRAIPVSERWHGWLLEARAGIPDIEPGDTVWWHCDMVHSVAPVENQQGWGNVMYIPATPWCTPNAAHASTSLRALELGLSASDFPAEHYERAWVGRFTINDLNETGRVSVGLE